MPALALAAERIRAAAASGRRLRVRGAGTKDRLSGTSDAEGLDMSGYAGIVDYAPSELFATVRAGTPLADLEAAVAAGGQCLPFEPPRLAGADGLPGGTVGGMVAAGLAGPARAAVGGVRDFVLGVLVLDGRGELLRFGGEVMKNVAGYDIARLFAGSWGGLGAVCEVSLKVLPRAPANLTLRFELDQPTALERVNAWSATPLPINASAWWRGALHVRLRGARAAVEEARGRLGGEALSDDAQAALWHGLRDRQHAFFADVEHGLASGRALWRLSLPSTTPALGGGGDTLIEWGGAQRWVVAPSDDTALAALARSAGGSAQCVLGGSTVADPRARVPVSPALQAIQRRLRAAFDPHGIFVAGRPVEI